MKNIVVKLTRVNPQAGPFKITAPNGAVIDDNVSRRDLIKGKGYNIDDSITSLKIESLNDMCKISKDFIIESYTILDYSNAVFTQAYTGCVWTHLNNITLYNSYYGKIDSYVIEYPFSYEFYDEVVQAVKDYTKAYQYFNDNDPYYGFGIFNDNCRIETNDKWFNKAILYNGQQSSGLLELVPKPINNLKEYNQYPIFNSDSKTIVFTKSDNFYQYNTFWAAQKSSQIPLFIASCESMSVDKIINTNNIDYSSRSFKKAPLRAKELKVRHILDNRSDVHLVSQFILTPSQISYK